jgi:hypothetical protein
VRPANAARAITDGTRKKLGRDRKAILATAHFGAEVIARNAPVDRGAIKASVHVERDGDTVRITLDAPHAGVLELGSRPHTPPLEPLIAWVKRHRASFGIEGKGTTRNKDTGRFEASPAVVAAARAIQRKIAREGTRPRYFVKHSLPAITAQLGVELARARAEGGKGSKP